MSADKQLTKIATDAINGLISQAETEGWEPTAEQLGAGVVDALFERRTTYVTWEPVVDEVGPVGERFQTPIEAQARFPGATTYDRHVSTEVTQRVEAGVDWKAT